MDRLPEVSKRPQPSVLLVGDSRMRQLQTAMFRELTGRINQMQFTSNDDYCDKREAINYTWYSEVLQTCPFNRTVQPYNFRVERWCV
jgi:hypothetical protein